MSMPQTRMYSFTVPFLTSFDLHLLFFQLIFNIDRKRRDELHMHNQKPNSSVFTSCPNRETKGRPAWEKCFLIRSLGETLKREQELVIVAILPPSLFLLFMTQWYSNFTHLSFAGGTLSSLSSLRSSSPVCTHTGL